MRRCAQHAGSTDIADRSGCPFDGHQRTRIACRRLQCAGCGGHRTPSDCYVMRSLTSATTAGSFFPYMLCCVAQAAETTAGLFASIVRRSWIRLSSRWAATFKVASSTAFSSPPADLARCALEDVVDLFLDIRKLGLGAGLPDPASQGIKRIQRALSGSRARRDREISRPRQARWPRPPAAIGVR